MKDTTISLLDNPNFRYVAAFVRNAQALNALQPIAQRTWFIKVFGGTDGVKFAERFEKYGLWFLIDQMNFEQEELFYSALMTELKA